MKEVWHTKQLKQKSQQTQWVYNSIQMEYTKNKGTGAAQRMGKQLSLNDHAIRRILLAVQSFVSLWRGAVRIPGLWRSHRGWQEMPKCRCIQYSVSSSMSKEYPRGINSHKITIAHQKCFKEIQSDLFAVKVSPRLSLLSVPIIKCDDSCLPYFRSSRLWPSVTFTDPPLARMPVPVIRYQTEDLP